MTTALAKIKGKVSKKMASSGLRFILTSVLLLGVILSDLNMAEGQTQAQARTNGQTNGQTQAKSLQQKNQQNDSQGQLLQIKSALEETLSQRMKNLISTKLIPNSFQVSVQIDLIKKSETQEQASNTDKENDSSITNGNGSKELPIDLSLGFVKSDEVIQNLQAQQNFLLNTNNNKVFSKDILESYDITKVEVLVGLDEELGSAYQAEFEIWLKDTVKKNYGGAKSSAKVSSFKKIPEKKVEEKTITIWEKLNSIQSLLGFAVFSMILIFSILLSKIIPSRDIKEQVQMNLRIQEMKQSQLNAIEAQARISSSSETGKMKSDKSNLNLDGPLLIGNLKELQKKMAFIILTSQGLFDDVIDTWFEAGDNGRLKIAGLMDAILTCKGVMEIDSKNSSLEQMEWNLPSKIRNDVLMFDAFKKFSNLNFEERNKILEKAYWDLISAKMLEKKAIKEPFSSLASLAPQKAQKVLQLQDSRVRTLAVLHLPQDRVQMILSEMSPDERKQLAMDAFQDFKVKDKELELADETLKYQIKKEEAAKSKEVDVYNLLPKFLSSFQIREEIDILSSISSQLSDNGYFIKTNYPSLAFLAEWPIDKIKLFLSGIDPSPLVTLIQLLPQLENQIIPLLPPRSAAILRDGLKELISDEKIETHLNLLKIRLLNLINDGKINLNQIFIKSASDSETENTNLNSKDDDELAKRRRRVA